MSLCCVVSAVDSSQPAIITGSPPGCALFFYLFRPTNSFKFQPQMTVAKSGHWPSVTERLIFSHPELPKVETSENSEQLQGGSQNVAFEVAQTSCGGGRRSTAGQNTLVPPRLCC